MVERKQELWEMGRAGLFNEMDNVEVLHASENPNAEVTS